MKETFVSVDRQVSGKMMIMMMMMTTVCDDTQNLNEIESETFFRYQICSIPNAILFFDTIFFDTDTNTFLYDFI